MKLPDKNKPEKGQVGVIYARYSSHKQKDVSIEQQIAECMKKAKGMGLPIIGTYEDRAISGKTDKRPNFQRMLKDAEAHKFHYLLAWKSNRVGRNLLEALANEQRLTDACVRIVYVEEDFEDNAAGRFALRSMMNVNQFYSENMAEDIKRAMMDNARKCRVNTKAPYGFKTGEDMRYAIDEFQASIVQEIFRRVAKGDKYIDIANSLNDRGIKSATGKDWHKNSFQAMVRNERYRGIYIYDDVRIENGMPRIIEDDLFFRVQEVIGMHRRTVNRENSYGEYLLTGKLYCGKCGKYMTGISGKSKYDRTYYFYQCNGKRDKSCNKKNVPRDKIEDIVANSIMEYICQDGVIEWLADKTVEHFKKKEEDLRISELKERIKNAKSAINNIMSAIEKGIFTDTTKDRLLALEKEQKEATEKLEAAQACLIPVDRNRLVAALSAYKNYNIKDQKVRRELFNLFLVAVYVYDNKIKIVFNFSGNKPVELPFSKKDIDDLDENSADAKNLFKVQESPPFIDCTSFYVYYQGFFVSVCNMKK